MVENEPPKQDQAKDEPQPTAYISPRLRSKMSDRYEEEEKSSTGTTIAVVGLIAVILVCGTLFLLGQQHAKKTTGQTADASPAPVPAMSDSAAKADSVAQLAAADSIAQAQSTVSKPTPAAAKAAAKAAKAAAAQTAGTTAGNPAGATAGAAAPAVAAPAPTRKFGIAVADFLFDDKAATEKDRLAAATSLEASVVPKDDGGTTTYQVVLGAFDSRQAAEAKGAELLGAGTVKESRVIALKKK